MTSFEHRNTFKDVGSLMEALPSPVDNAMRKLGNDIWDAWLRGCIPVAVMAQRAFISRTTLVKLEKGYRGVAVEPMRLFYLRSGDRQVEGTCQREVGWGWPCIG